MKILMLSWEYPPKNVGGLSTHVYNLSQELSNLGHEVHVVTCEEGTAPIEENNNGVYVHRVSPYKVDTDDFTKWVMHLNFAMIEECIRLIRKIGKIDIIHAHDWLTAYCAKVLKWSYKIPTVCTMHATEKGRNNGIRTEMQRYISSAEWLLNYEAWKVVVCSTYMKHEIINTFSIPEDKVWIIPNGVNTKDFEFDWLAYRRQFAADDEKIVFFIGRHVFEKGVQLLIDAAYGIVNGYGKVKFIIAGKGPMTEELKSRVRNMGLESKFIFTGYMNNESRDKFYKVSNVVVLPSLYEPFGIVAIEAMASGCPVIVSDTGGLSEIVEHRFNGMKMINGNTNSLKDNVLQLLNDEELCKYIRENAYKTVSENYTWSRVADLTVKMYNVVKEEADGTEWSLGGEITDKNEVKAKKPRRKAKPSASRISKKEEIKSDEKIEETIEINKKTEDGKETEDASSTSKRTKRPTTRTRKSKTTSEKKTSTLKEVNLEGKSNDEIKVVEDAKNTAKENDEEKTVKPKRTYKKRSSSSTKPKTKTTAKKTVSEDEK